jgi:hypothetical protein
MELFPRTLVPATAKNSSHRTYIKRVHEVSRTANIITCEAYIRDSCYKSKKYVAVL